MAYTLVVEHVQDRAAADAEIDRLGLELLPDDRRLKHMRATWGRSPQAIEARLAAERLAGKSD